MKTIRIIRFDDPVHIDEELSSPVLISDNVEYTLHLPDRISSVDIEDMVENEAVLMDNGKVVANVVILDNPRA